MLSPLPKVFDQVFSNHSAAVITLDGLKDQPYDLR